MFSEKEINRFLNMNGIVQNRLREERETQCVITPDCQNCQLLKRESRGCRIIDDGLLDKYCEQYFAEIRKIMKEHGLMEGGYVTVEALGENIFDVLGSDIECPSLFEYAIGMELGLIR